MFLSISIYDKSNASGSANLSIPISWGEFEIIKTIIQYCIPRFLGLDKQFESAVNTGNIIIVVIKLIYSIYILDILYIL